MCLPSVAIMWRKWIAKFCITRWRVEVSMLSTMDCRHIRTCYLKLKLSRKLSLNHNWVILDRIIRSNNEYALRNAIFRHFHWKINNNQLNETAVRKSANALYLTAKFNCDTPNSFWQIDISFKCVNYWSRYTLITVVKIKLVNLDYISLLQFNFFSVGILAHSSQSLFSNWRFMYI